MNYYPHHIGDYARDTAHLSMLEDGAYRRLLDLCYATEKPLPLDREKLNRLVRARSNAEKEAVAVVLGEFFIEGEDGWHQRRVEEELERAQEKSAKASASAAKRWHSQRNENAMRTHSEGNAPNSQEPRAKEKQSAQRSRGSRLPDGWKPDDELQAWARKERPDLDVAVAVARFSDHWRAQPGSRGVKLDWDATFRNWVRNEKAPRLGAHVQGAPPVAPKAEPCPCGQPGKVKVGGKWRCDAHVRGYEEAA